MVAAGIVVLGIGLAALAAGVRSGRQARPVPPVEPPMQSRLGTTPAPASSWVDPWLADSNTAPEDVIEAIPWLATHPGVGRPELHEAILRAMPQGEARAAAELLTSADPEAQSALVMLARAEPPPRFANHALGLALPTSTARAEAFERENEAHPSEIARRRALETYASLGDEAAIARLRSDPAYEAVADARVPYLLARQRLDWGALLVWMLPSQHARVSVTWTVLGVATALVWLMFLAYAGRVERLASPRLALCLAAIVLGALSTVPTLVASVWMEEVLGASAPQGLVGGVAYYVASVGLREEACKLLLFLPLAPIVIRRGDPLEMLLVASCVGLGFAAEENVLYFSREQGATVASRFLSANFGHTVSTGLIGFSFCRMFTERKVTDFLLYFVAIAIGHGVYDAFIVVPELKEWSAASFIIYVGVAFLYFDVLNEHLTHERRRVPLTAVFVLGLSSLLALGLAGVAYEIGFVSALLVMLPGTIGAALFTFVFFRKIDEALLP